MADDNLPWMKFYPSDFMGSRAVHEWQKNGAEPADLEATA